MLERGTELVLLTRRYPGLPSFESIEDVPVRRLGHQSGGKLGALTFAIHAFWMIGTRLRGYSIVHVQSQDVPLLVGMLARILLGRTLVVTVRSDPERVFSGMSRWRASLFRRVADVVAALSPEMARQLVAEGLPRDRVTCLPGGVDTALFRPPTPTERIEARARLGIEDGRVAFLFLGRLEEVKGLDILMQAWNLSASDTPRRLVIVGAGDRRGDLYRMVDELGLRDVSFEGETDAVRRYLHAADVFVLPSRWEGVSNALLEAMSTQLAVIVSDVQGNRALVEDHVSGVVFASGDAKMLASALLALEAPRARGSIGERARASILSKYSLEASIEAHRDLYSSLQARRNMKRR